MPIPESLACQQIDQLLAASGWTIQDRAVVRRLRHIVPEGEAVLRSAFEGRLLTDSVTESRIGTE